MKITTTQFATVFLLMVLLLSGCNREDLNPGAKPFVKTSSVTVNDHEGGGITLYGEFLIPTTYRSISYGFYLCTDESFNNKITIPAGTDPSPGKFEATVQVALKPNVKYYVKTWAKTEKYAVTGNSMEFLNTGSAAPIIDKVFPASGIYKDTILITGKNFDFFGKENKVFFNEEPAIKIWAKQDSIWAIVPLLNLTQNPMMTITVEVLSKKGLKGYPFALATPVISAVSATQGQHPDVVTVRGDNFMFDYSSLLIDGIAIPMENVTKKSFSFTVPYLKLDRTVKIELYNYKKIYLVSDKFHYLGQNILECSPNTAWIGDTIKLYAKNTDFSKMQLQLFSAGRVFPIVHKWKDSLDFIVQGIGSESTFNLDIMLPVSQPEYPYVSFTKKIDQKVIIHRPPLLVSLNKTDYAYRDPFLTQAKGLNWYNGLAGIVFNSTDGSVNLSLPLYNHETIYNELVPNDYSVQVSSNKNLLSNSLSFTVHAPSIENVSPSTFTRDNVIDVSGKFLPTYADYVFTHQESGRTFWTGASWNGPRTPTLQQVSPLVLLGEGTYRVEFKIAGKSYPYPGTLTLNDHFKFIRKLNAPLMKSTSRGCGFVHNNKVYIPQSNGMNIVDLATGNVRLKDENYSFDLRPVFLNDKIYMYIYTDAGGYQLCTFNEVTEGWDKVDMTGLPVLREGFPIGVHNNHLVAIYQGKIYQYDQTWTLLADSRDLGNYLFINYILSRNGNLYLFDFYNGTTTVISATDWKVIRQMRMPHNYQNSLRYVFELNNELYYFAIASGSGDQDYVSYHFNSNSETFEPLSPRKFRWDYYYHFCPDGKGNVYFFDNDYLYKFNP